MLPQKALSISLLFISSTLFGADLYYPGTGDDWQKKDPQQVGMDSALLKQAIDFAVSNETKSSRDLALAHYQSFGKEPFSEATGPFKGRGEPTGIILRKGYIVAEWGDPHRVDMTFSVTKSFLSTTLGLAYDRKMVADLHQPVRNSMAPITVVEPSQQMNAADRIGKSEFLDLFSSEHNKKITWDHLLRQVSDWEGTLWGKPDWADRPGEKPGEWITRNRNDPGTVYEYNDVRVNVLALATLNIWRRALPNVLKEYVMDPIGASATW